MLQTAQAGLNFASEDEAAKFKTSVEQKLLERHKRRMGKITGRGTRVAWEQYIIQYTMESLENSIF